MLNAAIGLLLVGHIWIVDDDGGPGVDFTDIQSAIDAAADGDVVLVHAGDYSHFTIAAKGLRVLGEDEATTFVHTSNPLYSGESTISSTPLDSVVTLERLTFGASSAPLGGPAPQRLRILGATTRAVLSRVAVTVSPSDLFMPLVPVDAAILIDAAETQILDCAVEGFRGNGYATIPGGPGVRAMNGARVHIASSTIKGGRGGSGVSLGVGFVPSAGGPGISVSSVPAGPLTWIWIADSSVLGAQGGLNGGTGTYGPWGAGLSVDSSRVRVSGGPTAIVYGAPGITTVGSAVVEVNGVVVTSITGPGIVLIGPELPVLAATGSFSLAGGSVTISLTNGDPGVPFVIAVDDRPSFFGIPGPFLGLILLEPPSLLFAAGTLDGTGSFALTITLAALPPSLAYLPFHFQAAALDGTGVWRLSNATVAILRP